jgi:flagellar basal-body rod modification protein FlgD
LTQLQEPQMDVTASNAATGTKAKAADQSASDAAADSSSSGKALSGDFNTFLKLLTAQLSNQDPLQPMESTAFVAQLASFSSVEQQIGSNTRLDKILSALGGSGADGLAGWIGRAVQAPASADFTGAPIDIAVTPVANADKAVLVVKNDFGREVARIAAAADEPGLHWDGSDAEGSALAHGRYSFALESYQGDSLLGTQSGAVFNKVTEVRRGSDGTLALLLEGGESVAPEAVTALR